MATRPSPPTLHRWAAAAACVLGTGGLWLAAAGPAWAHNTLIASSPEEGEVLDEAPSEVELEFDDLVMEGGNGIVVTGPDGATTYESGEVGLDDEKAAIDLEPLDEAGDYTVDFRIISADGHPIEDSLSFTLSDDALEAQGSGDTDNDAGGADEPATEIEDEPAAAEEEIGFGMPTWVAVVMAIALIGIVATIIVRLTRRN